MRVTIIRDDGLAGIGGTFRLIDLSALPSGVRAVQRHGAKGHVEYDDSANTPLNNVEYFQPFIDLWTAATLPPSPPLPPASATAKAAALARINAALFATLHGEFTGKRQKLRDQIAALGDSPDQKQLDAIQW